MLAVRIDQFGPPSALQILDMPEPSLGLSDVLVEVIAAGINPSDVKNVAGSMQHTTLPRIPGRDFAGVVLKGPDSIIGREVWGTGGDIGFVRDGSHAEYIALPLAAIRPKPRSLSMAAAGSIGVTFVTAYSCMEAAELTAEDTLVVVGATGGVGSAAMQIAKWKGAQVLGTVQYESDRALAEQAGADAVLNLADDALPALVQSATNGKGATIILDTVGGPLFEPSLMSLAPQGRLVAISAPAPERRVSFDLINFYHQEAKIVGVDSRTLSAQACANILAKLTPGFEAGALRPPASGLQQYALKDAIAAYEHVQNCSAAGRVMLAPE